MMFVEKFPAVEWDPAIGHPAVFTRAFEAGMSRDIHPDVAEWLDAGEGRRGIMYAYDIHSTFGWVKVEPGDRIVDRYDSVFEVVKRDEFSRRFSPA